MSYANALLPHALLLCGQWLERRDMAEVGLASLKWLADLQQSPAGHFVPIGSDGFYQRNGSKARFDQQPIEASTMVSACLEAYRMTGDESWYREARRSFEWFLGRNDLGLPLYDPTTGGCRDGLHPDRVNRNQGAESTMAFLLARSEMQLAENVIKSSAAEAVVSPPTNGRPHFIAGAAPLLTPDYAAELALAERPAELLERLDRKLTWGRMPAALKTEIQGTIEKIVIPAPNATGSNQAQIDSAKRNRVQAALLLVLAAPEFVVQP